MYIILKIHSLHNHKSTETISVDIHINVSAHLLARAEEITVEIFNDCKKKTTSDFLA